VWATQRTTTTTTRRAFRTLLFRLHPRRLDGPFGGTIIHKLSPSISVDTPSVAARSRSGVAYTFGVTTSGRRVGFSFQTGRVPPRATCTRVRGRYWQRLVTRWLMLRRAGSTRYNSRYSCENACLISPDTLSDDTPTIAAVPMTNYSTWLYYIARLRNYFIARNEGRANTRSRIRRDGPAVGRA